MRLARSGTEAPGGESSAERFAADAVAANEKIHVHAHAAETHRCIRPPSPDGRAQGCPKSRARGATRVTYCVPQVSRISKSDARASIGMGSEAASQAGPD